MYQHTARRPAGHTFETDLEGRLEEHDTLQCVHCARHWQVIVGSGRKRGFCMKCMGVTCGSQKCMDCNPWEKQMDIAEKSPSIIA